MSKDLHPSILQFFQERMSSHSNVLNLADVSTAEDYLFKISRAKQGDSLLVWMSDAYFFTDMDFHNRPAVLTTGDFILVAKPEAGFHVDDGLIELEGIGVGQIGKLMGALNLAKPWEYLTPQEREERQGRR
ncbi:hypothetical protein [Sphingomonas sp.]|uniref:hypothetical protein n=1 Tax=Sphingomonas sp. TaxID=28214 RepID=UPI0038AB4E75